MNKALIQLHVAVFLAGFTAILGKLITLNEGVLVWYRLFFSVVILGALMIFRGQLKRITWLEFFKIIGVGFILAFHWVTFYGSVKYANASVAVVCISMAGFFSSVFEPLILKKRIVLVELLLGLIALAGVYIIFDFHPHFKIGILFGVVAAMGSAIFPIFNKQLLEKHSPEVLTFYEFIGGLLSLTLLLPFYFLISPAHHYRVEGNDWYWLIIMACLCTVAAMDLQMNALKRISAFTVNLTYNLEPVYGVALAFVFFHEDENMSHHFYWGFFLIILSIVLQMLRVRRNNKPKVLKVGMRD